MQVYPEGESPQALRTKLKKRITLNRPQFSLPSEKPPPLPEQPKVEPIETRTMIMKEILTTETNYVASLETTIKKYVEPLKKHCTEDPTIGLDTIKKIFSNIEQIHAVSYTHLTLPTICSV
eukprot:TRINITY_DN6726_c0_g3_i4.p1 TRINITY_DN6726_c0_g3~~TRINITY_DN6726_c0_g3_i4.p1  ORF type:complete len:121 (-),score=23.14 TRINITY_DN6726_c0_g3_i4:21-383(-)